ncbi:MAG: transcription antitermination factor NusB [Spirochaetales bacterium]|nr:transcription antitermination factor NusB [Spirochaetales bacterium]
MGSRRQSRILAFQNLFGQDFNPQKAEEALSFSWMEPEEFAALEPDVLAFARGLIQGTLENWDTIDASIQNQLKRWDFNRIGKVDLAILRLSVFQMLFMKDIPVKVVIDEAINLAKSFASDESYRFVNGVLDGLRREKGL